MFQESGIPYTLLHHKSVSDPNLKIADYLCWAIQRNEVEGLDWSLKRVQHLFTEVSEVYWQKDEEPPADDPS